MILPNIKVLRFRVSLVGSEPEIWRRIEVPINYTFWDLHVAIQDAMGWLDYHLHEFCFRDGDGGPEVRIGIPDEERWEDRDVLPGWEQDLTTYFAPDRVRRAEYLYDFGDDWMHEVVLEDNPGVPPGVELPRCVDGARACPPEDCGGVSAYSELLAGRHPGQEDFMDFDPAEFDAAAVVFSDPDERWDLAFGPEE